MSSSTPLTSTKTTAKTTAKTTNTNTNTNTNTTSKPLPTRPITPLRPSSRSSIRASSRASVHSASDFPSSSYSSAAPLNAFEPAFAELADGMADLEANLMHLQLMHESLARFSENFAALLYGLNMNAFCVDFAEAPIAESFRRARDQEEKVGRSTSSDRFHGEIDGETTFLTTDTSFVDNPPTSSKATPKFATPAPASRLPGRGGIAQPAGRGGAARGGLRGTRGSGLARAAKGRAAK